MWDYEQIDRDMERELHKMGIWLCPLCDAYRIPEDTKDFTSQYPPEKPCKVCGHHLVHGIKGDDEKIGEWYPEHE